jgi:hypothetical protein
MLMPEGLCQWKIPMTQTGIDPANFPFIVQCLNHCPTASLRQDTTNLEVETSCIKQL